jgi:hypothetical protein
MFSTVPIVFSTVARANRSPLGAMQSPARQQGQDVGAARSIGMCIWGVRTTRATSQCSSSCNTLAMLLPWSCHGLAKHQQGIEPLGPSPRIIVILEEVEVVVLVELILQIGERNNDYPCRAWAGEPPMEPMGCVSGMCIWGVRQEPHPNVLVV